MKSVRFALLLGLVALGGCTGTDAPKGEPSFYRNLAQPGAELDATAAASMISGYRANNGLPTVTLDSELMRFAQAQAEVMAKRDKLDHGAGKPFVQRLKASVMTPRRRPKISVRVIRHSPKHFQVGATPTRIARICCWQAQPAWASLPSTRRRQNIKSTGR